MLREYTQHDILAKVQVQWFILRFYLVAFLLLVAGGALGQTKPASTTSQKLWATDLAAYAREHRGSWMVVRSTQPALTAGEATEDARHQAVKSLLPSASAEVEKQVKAALLADGLIEDEEVTANEKTYGTIWSASLLINKSPAKMAALNGRIQKLAVAVKVRRAEVAITSIVLGISVLCIYFILNTLTRGFLRLRLAVLSILMIVGGIFGIVNLI